MAPERKKRDPEATRSAILDAAETLFLEKGFGQTALSSIARQAGVTKSLIHHHFGSKEKLWDEVKVRRFAEYAEQQAAIIGQGDVGLDLFLKSIEAYFRFLQQHPEIARLMAWMSIEEKSDCVSELDVGGALVAHGAELVRHAQSKGILRDDVDPVHMILAAFSLASQWFHDRAHYCAHGMFGDISDPERLDDIYLETILKLIKRGISPR